MAFDFGSLAPRIRDILSAPGTDLKTISAKRVRRQLLENDSSLSATFLRDNKDEIDKVIAIVFEQVSNEATNGSDAEGDNKSAKSRKRKPEDTDDVAYDEDQGDEDEVGGDLPPPKKAKKAKSGLESDAALARKLSSEINGRSTRTGAKGRGASASGKKGARAKKSAATIDSDDDSDSGPKKKPRKSNGASGAKGGFAKEFSLSEPLAAVLQVDKLSRPQVVKQLWVYIKGNELQNPENKREIMCDPSLRAVFGVDKIDMFKMNQVLGQHLHENE